MSADRRLVKASISISVGPEQRTKAGVLPAGAMQDDAPIPQEPRWLIEGRPGYSACSLTAEVQSKTRRHYLLAAGSFTWNARYSGLMFGWAGGLPSEPIDLLDLDEEGPATAADYKEEVRGLLVLTDRFDPGLLTVDNDAGMNLFLEGEEEADYLVSPVA